MLVLKWISNKKAGMEGLTGFLTQHPDINELCFSHKSVSCLVLSDSLWPHGLYSTRLLCPWKSPEKNTGVGGHSLLQENFPTPGSNPGLSHCRRFFTTWAGTFNSMNLHWSQLLMMSSRLIWRSWIDMTFTDRHPAWWQLSYLGFMTLWNFPTCKTSTELYLLNSAFRAAVSFWLQFAILVTQKATSIFL